MAQNNDMKYDNINLTDEEIQVLSHVMFINASFLDLLKKFCIVLERMGIPTAPVIRDDHWWYNLVPKMSIPQYHRVFRLAPMTINYIMRAIFPDIDINANKRRNYSRMTHVALSRLAHQLINLEFGRPESVIGQRRL
jgi:hypothetical protein